MEKLRRNLPTLKYLFFYIKKPKRAAYMKYANVELVQILYEISLNLTFSNKNGLTLTKGQIRLLQRHRVGLNKLVQSKTTKDRRTLLTNDILEVVLSVILPIIAKGGLGNDIV